MKESDTMAKAKVKLIMTAILEVEIDPAKIFDLDEFPEDNQPMIEDAIKIVVEGYLDTPLYFIKDENTEIGIKHEVLEYKLPIQEYKGNNQFSYTEEQYKEYCNFYSIIANGDIGDMIKANEDLEKWIEDNKISDYMTFKMSMRMKEESEAEMGN